MATGTVNVSDAEFNIVASEAVAAYRRGDYESAKVLDKLARKMNVAIANKTAAREGRLWFHGVNTLKWQDVDGPLKLLGITIP